MKGLPRDHVLSEAAQVFLQHFGELAHTQDIAYEYLSSIWRTLLRDLKTAPPGLCPGVEWKMATTLSRDYRTRADTVNGPSGTYEVRLRAVTAPTIEGEELRAIVQEHLRFYAQDARSRPARGGATVHLFAAFQNQVVAKRARALVGDETYEARRRAAVEHGGWRLTGDSSVVISRDLVLTLESLGADVGAVDEAVRQLVVATARILLPAADGSTHRPSQNGQ